MAEATDGILYIAIGAEYVNAAVTSALSVRAVMPDVPLALATDGDVPPPFTHRVQINEDDGFRAKIVGMMASPFERTVMLDVDTHVCRTLAPVFDLLGRFDVAVAHAPNRITLPLDDVPESFPEFNTGVIGYVQSTTGVLLGRWLEEYDRIVELDPPSKDQPSFRRAVFLTTGLQVATLVPEYNLRFKMAGYVNQSVSVLHGWGDERTYRHVASAMNGVIGGWDGHAVFAGGRLFGPAGTVVGRWDDHGRIRQWVDRLRR